MDALLLKIEALAWLRFAKRLPYICTEVGPFNADVVGCNDDYISEIEVKVSKSDLKSEFTTKKAKHYRYAAAAEGHGNEQGVPNYFYIYVPEHLQESAISLVAAHYPKYGVIVYHPEDSKVSGKRSRVVKPPQKLHAHGPSEEFKRIMLLRMGSEICGRHIAVRKLTETFGKNLHDIGESISKQIDKIVKQEDFDG